MLVRNAMCSWEAANREHLELSTATVWLSHVVTGVLKHDIRLVCFRWNIMKPEHIKTWVSKDLLNGKRSFWGPMISGVSYDSYGHH